MKRARSLDQQTFRGMYEAHVGFVQFIARQAGCKDMEADDMVQETFLRLYQNPPDTREERAVRSWLAVTAKRVIIDLARKRRHESNTSDTTVEPSSAALWFRDEEALEHELELLAVRELIEEIASQPGGEDFRAFYVDGLKAREIAERRGESISSVTTRISRLRARFRENLRTRLQQLGHKSA